MNLSENDNTTNVAVFIMVYDVTNEDTVQSLREHFKSVADSCKNEKDADN